MQHMAENARDHGIKLKSDKAIQNTHRDNVESLYDVSVNDGKAYGAYDHTADHTEGSL